MRIKSVCVAWLVGLLFSLGCVSGNGIRSNGTDETSSSGSERPPATQAPIALSDSVPLMKFERDEYNENAGFCCFVDWGLSGWLYPKSEFPNTKLFELESQNYVHIRELTQRQPIVILVSSITCPAYDINIEKLKRLELKYKGRIVFYTLYTRENHPGRIYTEHKSFDQKVKYAKELKAEDGINHILIDLSNFF